ncbi:hypothetical protein [Bacillus shivajii]|nr:hypothetical protein [Bacillus shivajii]
MKKFFFAVAAALFLTSLPVNFEVDVSSDREWVEPDSVGDYQ